MRAVKLVPTLLTTALLMILILGPGVTSNVGAQDGATEPQVNVELILDASGSMADELEPGVTRIEVGRGVLTDLVAQLPDDERVNVGLRVYGQEGNNTEAGRSESCQATELRVPVQGVDRAALQAEIDAWEPVGWTPLALAMQESGNDFPSAGENVINATVLVTDGLETCGGDPCSVSESLVRGPSEIITHVIGFATTPQEQGVLKCITDASGGLLLGAENADELAEALFLIFEEIEVIVANGLLEIESIGGTYPAASVTQTGTGDVATSVAFGESNVLELPAGTYQVTWTNPSGESTTIEVAVIADETTVIRGSLLRFPHGGGQIYELAALDGTIIWQAPIELGDVVWVLPGTYRLSLAETIGDAILLSATVQTLPGTVTGISVTTEP